MPEPFDFSQYFNPTKFGGSSGGNSSTVGNLLKLSDPVGGNILANLFGLGGGGNEFKPYVDEKGNYVWNDPNKYNPVPVTGVPGASQKPTDAYRQVANDVRTLMDLLPYYSTAIAGQQIPDALAKLEAEKAVSDPTAQLMLDLYKKFGPQLNEVGNLIAAQNAEAQAKREKDIISGTGRDLVQEALKTAQLYDPEYFKTRAETADQLTKLFENIDLTGNISESERRQIEQLLSKDATARGVQNAPSATETVARGLTYGQAGRNRQVEERNALTTAINAANQFLPASKSGVDVFSVATGRGGTNVGNNLFTGITNPLNTTAEQAAGNLFGQSGGYTTQKNQIEAGQYKDWLDQFQQFTQGLGNIGSFAGGIAGGAVCWIAREVYGESNPKWKVFRCWLIFDSPNWLFKLYYNYGERIAKFISNKPKIKKFIKHFMDKVTN